MLEFVEWDRLVKDTGHKWWQLGLQMHGEVHVMLICRLQPYGPIFPYVDTWHSDMCTHTPIAYSNIRSCVHIVIEVGCEDACGGGGEVGVCAKWGWAV